MNTLGVENNRRLMRDGGGRAEKDASARDLYERRSSRSQGERREGERREREKKSESETSESEAITPNLSLTESIRKCFPLFLFLNRVSELNTCVLSF